MDKKIKFNILAIFCIVIFCIAITPVTLQNDTFYTIKIGEHVLENGIDMQDPFSWHEGLKYTYPHWGYDVLTYVTYNLAGYLGIYLFTAFLSAILGITIYLTNSKLCKNRLIAFFVTIGVVYLLRSFIAARAQLITFILFLLTIYFIERFLETKKKRYAVGLIIIPILIANFHVAVWPFYFVIYLPYIGEYLISLISVTFVTLDKIEIKLRSSKLEKIEAEEEKEKMNQKILKLETRVEKAKIKKEKIKQNAYKIIVERNDATRWLIVIMIICVLTGLLTPLGDTPYTYLIKTMKGNTTENISEHLPLTPINNKEFLAIFVLLMAILMFTDTKIRLNELFLLGGLIVLTLMARRQMSLLVLLGSIAFSRLCYQFVDKYDKEGAVKAEEKMITLVRKSNYFSSNFAC